MFSSCLPTFSRMSIISFAIKESNLKVMQNRIKHGHTSPVSSSTPGVRPDHPGPHQARLSLPKAGPFQFCLNHFGKLPLYDRRTGCLWAGGGARRDLVEMHLAWPALLLPVKGVGLHLPFSNWFCRVPNSLVALMAPFFCLCVFCLTFNAQLVLPRTGHLTGELGAV